VATSHRSDLFDQRGKLIRLGPRLGTGGEGSVFALAEAQDRAIKVYHRPPTANKVAKIVAMTRLANQRLTALAAWPLETVHSAPAGPVVGFAMPNVSGHKPVFELYSPKCRLQEFPTAGWPFLIRCAANAARAFRVIHDAGSIIGDVNHGNLLIARDATVKLIDCDSFQVRAGSQQWLCEVGVPEFQPPELQGVSFGTAERRPNHDYFGLAVLTFRLLFMGRHPFIGQFLGKGDMPVERAVKEYRFAYGVNAGAMQMRPPPGSLSMSNISPALSALFERAFARQGSQPDGRPGPSEWISGLDELSNQIKICTANPGHRFWSSLSKCPWCDIEAYGGFALFPVVFVPAGREGAFNLAALWQRVSSIPDPGAAPSLSTALSVKTVASPAAATTRSSRRKRFAAAAASLPIIYLAIALTFTDMANAIALVLTGLIFYAVAFGGRKDEIRTFRQRVDIARQHWHQIEQRWELEGGNKAFAHERSELERTKSLYESLPQERMRRLRELEINRHAAQKRAFLDKCFLAAARIKGIGDGRKAVLLAHNIETAADIEENRILAIPGFGESLVSNLIDWRHKQEARFRFDPNRGVDPNDKMKVEQEFMRQKAQLEQSLTQGANQLSAVAQQIRNRRAVIKAEADRLRKELAQAEADSVVVESPGSAPFAFASALAVAIMLFILKQPHSPTSIPPPVARDFSRVQKQDTPPPSPAASEQPSAPTGSHQDAPKLPAAAPEQSRAFTGQPRETPPLLSHPTKMTESTQLGGGPSSTVPALEQDQGLPYPQRLAKLFDLSDWPFVLAAVRTAERIETVALVSWSNPSNGHEGNVRRAESNLDREGCVNYRIMRRMNTSTRVDYLQTCNGEVRR